MDKNNNEVTNDLRQILAAKINKLLKIRGLNIEEAALESELEYSNFYYITKGKKMPRVDTLIKIANGLNVPPEYFLRDMQIKLNRQTRLKNDLLRSKVLNELSKLDRPTQTLLFNMLKMYNRQK